MGVLSKSEVTQVGWWEGLGPYYIKEWPATVLACLFFFAAFVAIWIYNAGPFLMGSAVTSGTVTSVWCGTKGYDYDYSYKVGAVRYSGHARSGAWDGNVGRCADRVGQRALITYSQSHPERSLGGTVKDRFTAGAQLMGALTIVMMLIGMPLSYTKQRRQTRNGQLQDDDLPLSRQQRRALERRQRKADGVE